MTDLTDWPDWIYGDDEPEEEQWEPEFDCGLADDGACTKAVSEECDWECPYSGVGDEGEET